MTRCMAIAGGLSKRIAPSTEVARWNVASIRRPEARSRHVEITGECPETRAESPGWMRER